MSRTSPLVWFALILILLLPTAGGRFLIDLAGGFVLFLLALPVLVAGGGWLTLKILQSRMRTCEVCGISTLSNSMQCPACGSNLSSNNKQNNSSNNEDSTPASSATIDITAKETD